MNRQLLHIFRWHVLRYIAQHRLLAALNILSVALGVATYLAIQVANQSANRAFAATIDVVAGKADLQITAAANGVPESLFPPIARQNGISAATPLVRGFVTLPDLPGEYLQVLGVDIFTNDPFRTFQLSDFTAGSFDLQRWLGERDVIAVTREFADAHQLTLGSSLRAQVNGVDRQLRIGFIIQRSELSAVDPHVAAMDIGWAQELFDRRGVLSEIQVQLNRSAGRDETVRSLRAILPPDVDVRSPAQRGEQVGNMLGGFQLNLTAMSFVSLLVGMFLIYNTVSASVVRRRREIGILRSLGTTRNEVRALFLSEALALGALGSVLGVFGGLLLARALLGTVSETISALYVLVSLRETATTPLMIGSAIVIGLVSVVVAAWLPAAAAAKTDPIRALHGEAMAAERAAQLSSRWWLAGVLSLIVSAVVSDLALATGPPWLGFGAAFFVLGGFSLLAPHATIGFSKIAGAFFRRTRRTLGSRVVEPDLAATNLSRSLVRNAVTIAALAAAIAMTIGVTVMVFSFRRTVRSWIDQTLVADLFIAPASNEIVGPSSFIPREALDYLRSHAAVNDVDTFREIDLPSGDRNIAVAVIRGSEHRRLQFLRGDLTALTHRLLHERCVVVSESFARKNHMHDGDTLTFSTPAGPQPFSIAGTFYDYTRDEGIVYMSAETFLPIWKDDRVNSAAVYLKPGTASSDLVADFRARFSQSGQFMILSNRELRTRIFEIFDQTFAVTYVLRTIAVIVAVVGICLTLTTLIAERSRELGVLRAIGASVAQLRRLLLWESALIGLLAAIIGLGSGLCLSFVLTGVINRAFFGWTIQLAFPWSALAFTPVWIVGAALAAGVLPAWRGSRLAIAEALRVE